MYRKIVEFTRSLEFPQELILPTPDEFVCRIEAIQKKYRHQVSITRGISRQGRTVLSVEVGSGKSVIALTAGAHSDEPAGSVTALIFIENLVTNPAYRELIGKYRFLIHPMLDPDGAALNHRWTGQEFSYREYLLHNFRNGKPAEDCEHGIPASSAQTIRPELGFFKNNVDRYKGKIQFYITLHTTHRLGGSIFILAGKGNHLDRIQCLTRLCQDFNAPVDDYDHHGEDGIEFIAPGFLTAPPMAAMIEKYKDVPEILEQIKLPTYEYVQNFCGAQLGLISELPSVIDVNLTHHEETQTDLIDLKRDSIRRGRIRLVQLRKAVVELERLGVDQTNPWFDKARFSLANSAAALDAGEKQLALFSGIKAKRAELTDHPHTEMEKDLGIPKLFVKCLEKHPEQRALYDEQLAKFNQMYEQLERLMKIKVLPLDSQVRLQAAMIFTGLEF